MQLDLLEGAPTKAGATLVFFVFNQLSPHARGSQDLGGEFKCTSPSSFLLSFFHAYRIRVFVTRGFFVGSQAFIRVHRNSWRSLHSLEGADLER